MDFFLKYNTEGSWLNLNKDRSGHRKTERIQENINLPQEKLIENPRMSARKNDMDISYRVHLSESLSMIWNGIPIRCMYKKKEKATDEVDLLKDDSCSSMQICYI